MHSDAQERAHARSMMHHTLRQQHDQLAKDNAQLREEVARLHSDNDALRQVLENVASSLRTQLGYIFDATDG